MPGRLSFLEGQKGLEQAADDQHEPEDDQGDADDGAHQGHREDHAHDHQNQAEDGADQPASGFDGPHDQAPDQPKGVKQPMHVFFIMSCHIDLHLTIRRKRQKVAKIWAEIGLGGLTT